MTTRHDPVLPALPVLAPIEVLEPLEGKTAREHTELANGTKIHVRAHASGRRFVWSAAAVDNSTIGQGYVKDGIVHTTFGTCPSDVQRVVEAMADSANDPTALRKQREEKAARAKSEAIAKADEAWDEANTKASAKHLDELTHAHADAAKAAAAAQAKAEKSAAK